MPNIFWFIALAVIGIGIALFTILKNKNTYELVSVYLFMTALSYNGEALVLGLFNAYSYHTGVVADNWAENILGHILLNSTVWPATALAVIAFSIRYRWIPLISAVYMLLDYFCVRVGIYEHKWWGTWMTGAAIAAYCAALKALVPKLSDRRFGALRYAVSSCILWTIMYTPTVPLLLAGKEFYSIGWFRDMYLDSAMSAFACHAILSFISAFFVCVLRKLLFRLLPFALFIGGDVALMLLDRLNFLGWWNIFYLALVRAACLLLFLRLNARYLSRLVPTPPQKRAI